MVDFQEWNATKPGTVALKHTQYEVRHELVGGTWYFNVYWRGDCVRPGHMLLESAKREALKHMKDMLEMGYEV